MNEVFKALADPTRRAILQELKRGSKGAGELAELFPLAKSTLSGHFNVLKATDLVVAEKQGTSIIYHLNTSVFAEIMNQLMGWFGVEADTEGTPDETVA